MLQLKEIQTEQELFVTRLTVTPEGVSSWRLILTCRATNQTTFGDLELSSENDRVLVFNLFVNTNESNNVNLQAPNFLGGWYNYEVEAISASGTKIMSTGLLFYDLQESAVTFDTFDSQTTFKGYE